MINKILEQGSKSIGRFEKVLRMSRNVWVPRGILISEGFIFCALCDLYDVDIILESGVYNAGSTLIWAKYFKKEIKSWDVTIRNDAKDRVRDYPRVELIQGDGRFGIREYLNRHPFKKVGIFLDGPKGVDAVNWAKRFMGYSNVKFATFHDCHKLSYGKENITRIEAEKYQGTQFYSDLEPFVKKYAYLDKEIIGKKDEEQGIYWQPYKISDDKGVHRCLGSYGMTIGGYCR